MKIKIGKYLFREKPKEMWRGRGIYWIFHIVALPVIFIYAFLTNNTGLAWFGQALVIEYFLGDLLIYHKLEKEE